MNTRKLAAAVLVAAFLLGCLAGATGNRIWGERERWRQTLPWGLAGMDKANRLEHLLQLSPAQQAQLKEIYAALRQQIAAHQAEADNKYETLRTETNNRIADILSDEQKKKFEQYVKDADGRRASSRRRGTSGEYTLHH
jgi:Spy/CpxP family protein refolding chaperone